MFAPPHFGTSLIVSSRPYGISLNDHAARHRLRLSLRMWLALQTPGRRANGVHGKAARLITDNAVKHKGREPIGRGTARIDIVGGWK
jgi:hypothetical protein